MIILWCWLAMSLVMLFFWIVQTKTRNAGIVDIAWSFGTGLCGVALAFFADGDIGRRWVVGSIATCWSLRLGLHLFRRLTREDEDGRYTHLRTKWGDRASRKLFYFFQLQAFWAVLFALPMWAAATNGAVGLRPVDFVGIAIAVVALFGESVADAQLARFRASPANAGKVCRFGLWRLSRHPNYFFEWTHWFAYACLGSFGPHWWIALAGPIVMLYFLLRVTGIPPTEARAIESRGDAYRDYQRTTSAFFAWFPKGESS